MSVDNPDERWIHTLSKHATLILSAFRSRSGEIPDTTENDSAIADLITNRIAIRRDDGTVRLAATLRRAMDFALITEKLYILDTNVGQQIAQICDLANDFNKARITSPIDAERILLELDDLVYTLCDALKEASRQIWRRINTRFSNVNSLDLKLKLNAQSLKDAEQIVAAIDNVKLEHLFSISGSNPDLRRLFNVQLANSLQAAGADMADAADRLTRILFDFRRMEKRTALVQLFHKHYRANPDYVPTPYHEMAKVPHLFSIPSAIPLAGYAPIHDSSLEIALSELIVGMREIPPPEEHQEVHLVAVSEEVEAVIEHVDSILSTQITDVFVRVLESGESISGIDAYLSIDCEEPPDIWLYALLASHTGMTEEKKSLFKLDFVGQADPEFTGNFVATDIIVCNR